MYGVDHPGRRRHIDLVVSSLALVLLPQRTGSFRQGFLKFMCQELDKVVMGRAHNQEGIPAAGAEGGQVHIASGYLKQL